MPSKSKENRTDISSISRITIQHIPFSKRNEKNERKLLTFFPLGVIIKYKFFWRSIMEHIKTLETRNLCESAKNGGCGECQTSCQSACKTSCGIANQQCENK